MGTVDDGDGAVLSATGRSSGRATQQTHFRERAGTHDAPSYPNVDVKASLSD